MRGTIAGVVLGAALMGAAACSVTPTLVFSEDDAGGGGSDATAGNDVGPPTPDAQGDVAQDVRGADVAQNDAGADAADGGDAGAYQCGATRVNDCATCVSGKFLCVATATCIADCKQGCTNAPIECVACTGGQPVARVCEPTSAMTACITGAAIRCTCNNNPNECFGPRQVCSGNQCLACGEATSDNKNCTGGSKCDTQGGGQQYECH